MSKLIQGVVRSISGKNSVVVETKWSTVHPKYKKIMRRTTAFMAHDLLGSQVGQSVLIKESRPISKRKAHIVEAIL